MRAKKLQLFTLFCKTGSVKNQAEIYYYANFSVHTCCPSHVERAASVFVSHKSNSNQNTQKTRECEPIMQIFSCLKEKERLAYRSIVARFSWTAHALQILKSVNYNSSFSLKFCNTNIFPVTHFQCQLNTLTSLLSLFRLIFLCLLINMDLLFFISAHSFQTIFK